VRALDLINVQWARLPIEQVRPSTVIPVETDPINQIMWRWKARERGAKWARPMLMWSVRGNSRAWSLAAPRPSVDRQRESLQGEVHQGHDVHMYNVGQ
jgi:hypothetical protein